MKRTVTLKQEKGALQEALRSMAAKLEGRDGTVSSLRDEVQLLKTTLSKGKQSEPFSVVSSTWTKRGKGKRDVGGSADDDVYVGHSAAGGGGGCPDCKARRAMAEEGDDWGGERGSRGGNGIDSSSDSDDVDDSSTSRRADRRLRALDAKRVQELGVLRRRVTEVQTLLEQSGALAATARVEWEEEKAGITLETDRWKTIALEAQAKERAALAALALAEAAAAAIRVPPPGEGGEVKVKVLEQKKEPPPAPPAPPAPAARSDGKEMAALAARLAAAVTAQKAAEARAVVLQGDSSRLKAEMCKERAKLSNLAALRLKSEKSTKDLAGKLKKTREGAEKKERALRDTIESLRRENNETQRTLDTHNKDQAASHADRVSAQASAQASAKASAKASAAASAQAGAQASAQASTAVDQCRRAEQALAQSESAFQAAADRAARAERGADESAAKSAAEVARLKRSLSGAREETGRAIREQEDLQGTVQRLEREADELRRAAAAAAAAARLVGQAGEASDDAERRRAREENEALRDKVRSLEEGARESQAGAKRADATLEQARGDVARWKAEGAEAGARAEAATAQAGRARAQVSEAEVTADEARRRRMEAEDACRTAQGVASAMESKMRSLREEAEKAAARGKAQSTEHGATLTHLRGQLGEAERRLVGAEERIQASVQKQGQSGTMEVALAQAEKEVARLQEKMRKGQAEASEASTAREGQHMKKIALLEEHAEKEKTEYTTLRGEIQTANTCIAHRKEEMEAERMAWASERGQMEDDIRALRKALSRDGLSQLSGSGGVNGGANGDGEGGRAVTGLDVVRRRRRAMRGRK